MPTLLQVDIVSPEGAVYSAQATHVTVKGEEGELGIFPGHNQLLSRVVPGPVHIYREDGEEDILFVSGGILEIQPTHVSLLADVMERPQDVNEAAALEAKRAAEQLLLGQSESVDATQARYQLAEALAKLRVLELINLRRKKN